MIRFDTEKDYNKYFEDIHKTINLAEENQELKKQIEQIQQDGTALLGINETLSRQISMIKNQQKEFIKYLEDERGKSTPKARWKHYNEDGFNDYYMENGDYIKVQPVNVTLNEILLKFKEIVGDK